VLTLHAWRGAALANLGRAGEARREVERFYHGVRANWINDEPATDRMIGRWFLQLYPFSRTETWERLRDGLAALGIPVDGVAHTVAPDAE
jgi:hypothetical protein